MRRGGSRAQEVKPSVVEGQWLARRCLVRGVLEVEPSDRRAVAREMLPCTADDEHDLIDVALAEPGVRHGLLP
jgi:hypothetical protein